jgi:glucan phosphoethanolaminetransferase (alkaline phosphatase superfamily)
LYAVWWSVLVVHTIGPHPNYYNLSSGRKALRDDTRENNLLKIRTRVQNI